MARKVRAGRSRGRVDDGAVLVEAAIVLPLLIALLFGIIDFGFVFNDWVAVRQGGRDGLRQAIVSPTPAVPPSACTPVGGSPGTDAKNLVCYTKDRVGLDQSKTRVKIYFDSAKTYKAGEAVKVCVQYQTSSKSGFYGLLNGKVLDTEVESLIEQTQTTFAAPYAETPLTSWPASCGTL